MKYIKSFLMLFLVVVLTGCSSSNSEDATHDPDASGTLTIDQTQVMLIIGGSSGDGVLEFKGKSYPFELGGLKLGGIGIHKLNLIGDVYFLNNVEDFEGTYFSAEAAITVAKGVGGFWMKNSKGVKIKLDANSEGLALGLGIEGTKISFKK